MDRVKTWVRQNPHCLAFCYFIFYLIAFFTLEALVEPRYILHSPLDDLIPFNEWFLIPYCAWFLQMPGSLAYFMFRDRDTFLRECFLMFTGMTICLTLYWFFPNGLDLRVAFDPHRNLLCELVALLQGFDTPTNVCPSIHVASALAVDITVQKCPLFRRRPLVRLGSFVLMVLIVLSTMFLKQHSVIDVFWGILLTLALSLVTYHLPWEKALQKTPLRFLWGQSAGPKSTAR